MNYEKTISIILSLLFVCLLSAFTSADTTPNGTDTSTKVEISTSDYEILNELNQKSDAELRSIGFSDSDIEDVRNFDELYLEHLYELSEASDDTLKAMGYTNEQITIFRNFTGSPEQLEALAATLDFSFEVDYVLYTEASNTTASRLLINFVWNGNPIPKLVDMVVVSWNDWTRVSSFLNITYYDVLSTRDDIVQAATFVPPSGPNSSGLGYKFAMDLEDNRFCIKSGSGSIVLLSNYGRKDLSAYAVYGRSTVVATPTFSLMGPGGVSFSVGVQSIAEVWRDEECQN